MGRLENKYNQIMLNLISIFLTLNELKINNQYYLQAPECHNQPLHEMNRNEINYKFQ